uniref:Succinate dehydrogenase subunit 3 n=1 Tax=Gracilariopsis mclachlanii TaxID=486813 RepID=A0A345UBL7_9FLOR|nr:succinate dehydrogenase subunit 3 [Gracilariopsis mclachlanii]AXI97853.1 succinate dehydrogenase subunit 3 [Gracilariopsis mclachlanii]
MYNRPISPHITIYKPQISSLFSVWHRISGLFLTFLIVFFLIYLQLSLHSINALNILNSLITQWGVSFIFQFIYIFSLSIFFYHTINGAKHIIWDLGYFIHSKFLVSFVLIISFFIFLVILLLS